MNLTNHFLIAMPGLEDAAFSRSVVYVCEHTERGALGLVINKPSDINLQVLFDKVDLLLTPSAPGEAPKGLASTGDPVFNSIWTLAGAPCVTLPAGTGPRGLPLGVQLVGPRHADDHLLSLAAWVAAHLS